MPHRRALGCSALSSEESLMGITFMVDPLKRQLRPLPMLLA